jgi:hypothetical protein
MGRGVTVPTSRPRQLLQQHHVHQSILRRVFLQLEAVAKGSWLQTRIALSSAKNSPCKCSSTAEQTSGRAVDGLNPC